MSVYGASTILDLASWISYGKRNAANLQSTYRQPLLAKILVTITPSPPTIERPQSVNSVASAKNISVRAEWLRQSGCAPSEPSETPQWRNSPRPASIQNVVLHIALQSPLRRFFSLCRSPILNKHSGVVANCDHALEWVHWVHACIGIAMGDAAKISPHVPSTLSLRIVGMWEDMILQGHEDPRICMDPRNLGMSQ
jgi:hypothetical protein